MWPSNRLTTCNGAPDIADLQMAGLIQAQAGPINGHEEGPILGHGESAFEQLLDFLDAVGLRAAHPLAEARQAIVDLAQRPSQHFPVKEAQAVDRHVDGAGRVARPSVQMIEVGANLLVAQLIGRAVMMPRQLSHHADVSLDGARGISLEGEDFDEFLA